MTDDEEKLKVFTYPQKLALSLASEIASKFGLIAGIPDGYDKAGRQKLRMLTPKEIAERSCEIAAYMLSEFDKHGWLGTDVDEVLGKK